MNMDDKTNGCSSVEKHVTKLAQMFDKNGIDDEEFCKNALIYIVVSDRKCWLPLIRSLTPKNKLVLHAYCTANVGEGFEPPAQWCMPARATAQEVDTKRAELLPKYIELAEVIANLSASK